MLDKKEEILKEPNMNIDIYNSKIEELKKLTIKEEREGKF